MVSDVYTDYYDVSLYAFYIARRSFAVGLDNLKFSEPTVGSQTKMHLFIKHQLALRIQDTCILTTYIKQNCPQGLFIYDKLTGVLYQLHNSCYGYFMLTNPIVFAGEDIPYDPTVDNHKLRYLQIKDNSGQLHPIAGFRTGNPELNGDSLSSRPNLNIINYTDQECVVSDATVENFEALNTVKAFTRRTNANNRFIL